MTLAQTMVNKATGAILAFDVGDRRIGVAVANRIARLANPLTTVDNDESTLNHIKRLVEAEGASTIVIGLPRNLRSEDTGQTRTVRNFAAAVKEETGLEVVMQDEALTSRKAEAELRARGRQFAKGDIDALAAVYILEDYLRTLEVNHG